MHSPTDFTSVHFDKGSHLVSHHEEDVEGKKLGHDRSLRNNFRISSSQFKDYKRTETISQVESLFCIQNVGSLDSSSSNITTIKKEKNDSSFIDVILEEVSLDEVLFNRPNYEVDSSRHHDVLEEVSLDEVSFNRPGYDEGSSRHARCVNKSPIATESPYSFRPIKAAPSTYYSPPLESPYSPHRNSFDAGDNHGVTLEPVPMELFLSAGFDADLFQQQITPTSEPYETDWDQSSSSSSCSSYGDETIVADSSPKPEQCGANSKEPESEDDDIPSPSSSTPQNCSKTEESSFNNWSSPIYSPKAETETLTPPEFVPMWIRHPKPRILRGKSSNHPGKNVFPCYRCPRYFFDRISSSRHQLAHALRAEYLFCKECGKSFSKRHDFILHQKFYI